MRVQILHGKHTGQIQDVPRSEAETLVTTGFAAVVVEPAADPIPIVVVVEPAAAPAVMEAAPAPIPIVVEPEADPTAVALAALEALGEA